MSNPLAKAHYRQTVKAIRHAFNDLPANISALEIGSGPGTWTDLCLEKASSMKVFDISVEFFKLMKQKYNDESRVQASLQGDYAEDITNMQGLYVNGNNRVGRLCMGLQVWTNWIIVRLVVFMVGRELYGNNYVKLTCPLKAPKDQSKYTHTIFHRRV